MKKLNLIALAILALVAAPAFAQNKTDAIELLSDTLEVDRKAIITMNVNLSDDESKQFWPLYNVYRDEMKEVNARLLGLISKYADNYDNLTDEVAAELMVEAMDIEEDRGIYKRLYVEDLSGFLPTTKVAKLFQIENKIEAALKYELAEQIPFVNTEAQTETAE